MNRNQLPTWKISWNVSGNYYWAMQYRFGIVYFERKSRETLVNYIVNVYSHIIMVWDIVKTVMCRWKSSSVSYYLLSRYLSTKLKIVIIISEYIKRHSKAKHTYRTPAYSRALQRIKGVFQRVVCDELSSDFPRVRGDRVAVKVGVVEKC